MEVFTNSWNSRKYQIGYALSGGFIKGFAHLGVMQALWSMMSNRILSPE